MISTCSFSSNKWIYGKTVTEITKKLRDEQYNDERQLNLVDSGMRIGELLGLTWDCVDFDNGIIKIRKTLPYLPNGGDAIYEFHRPKTKAGKRDIPMTVDVKEALLEQKRWKSPVAIRHNPRLGMEDLVFCSKTNNPIHESNVRGTLRYLIDKINR